MSKTIDGQLFAAMIIEGSLAIEAKKEQANELNVFPVPDGDTGTNMSMTMASARAEMSKLTNPDLATASTQTASALLRGARGNSGVILSLLFRGMSKHLKTCTEATGSDLAIAFNDGVQAAYKAVMKPAEGTILTVSRVATQHALELCQSNPELTCGEVLDAVLERGEQALAETQHQNPVLEKAGVVDAGGFGFLTVVTGMRDAYNGIHHEYEPAQTEAAAPAANGTFSSISDEDITYTYCTEFIAERKDRSRNVQRLRSFLNSIGDSLVVVDDDDIIKVHVHTDQPNEALAAGLKFGPLLTVKIENMRQQHSAKIVEEAANLGTKRQIAAPEKPYGFVSIAVGEGLVNVFHDLGVDKMVEGGQTMNPSTDDILHAIDAVPAETVFVLPNNKNIIMAAEQAVPLCEGKTVVIIPTKTIPQGISAMLAFDESCDMDTNRQAMVDAASNVRTGQVTYAARNSDFGGKKIKQGEYLSLLESKLCANTRKMDDAIKRLVREMTRTECSFVNIIYGEDMTEEDAARVEKMFAKEAPDAEVTIIPGGQPIYYFILSAEG